MRRVPHMLLVLVLAFALSGAEALASDCCGENCREEAGESHEPGAPPEDTSDACPSCIACPCARLGVPVPGEALVLPGLALPLPLGWWEEGLRPAGPHARGVFQPPRAG